MAIAYREGAQREVCSLALSADGGASWHTQDLVGPQGRLPWPSDATLCYEAVAAYGPDGTLYYAAQATLSFANPFSRIFVTSTRDGVAFQTPVDVDPAQVHNAGRLRGRRLGIRGSRSSRRMGASTRAGRTTRRGTPPAPRW